MRGLRGLGIQGLANPIFSAGCPGGGLMSTILSYNPIAYWPLNELSGTAAINYGSLGTAANGLHVGDTLAQMAFPGGGLAPSFNGTTNYVNVYTAALAAAFNGLLGTYVLFVHPYDIVETGGVATLGNSTDYYNFTVETAPNYRCRQRTAGSFQGNSFAYTAVWAMLSVSWSFDGTNTTGLWYLNNVLKLTQVTGGQFTGSLNALFCTIMSSNSTPTTAKQGYAAHMAIYTSVLTQPQIAAISSAGCV